MPYDGENEFETALSQAWACLEANRLDEAAGVLNGLPAEEPSVINARAVLCLRQNKIQAALELLRPLALPNERSTLDDSADPAWCANFCVALLLADNRGAFIEHVPHLKPASHPAVRCLTDALNAWQRTCKNLPAFKRLLGQQPPLTLPPGTPLGWPDAAVQPSPVSAAQRIAAGATQYSGGYEPAACDARTNGPVR
jgi:hypothetical protein